MAPKGPRTLQCYRSRPLASQTGLDADGYRPAGDEGGGSGDGSTAGGGARSYRHGAGPGAGARGGACGGGGGSGSRSGRPPPRAAAGDNPLPPNPPARTPPGPLRDPSGPPSQAGHKRAGPTLLCPLFGMRRRTPNNLLYEGFSCYNIGQAAVIGTGGPVTRRNAIGQATALQLLNGDRARVEVGGPSSVSSIGLPSFLIAHARTRLGRSPPSSLVRALPDGTAGALPVGERGYTIPRKGFRLESA
eukprot:82213-Prorocentrum_minimum.AAC.1